MSAKIAENLFFSRPTIHASKKELSYPLYSADFDPLNNHFLLVGGGGGSSSTGVPNKITLLDASKKSELNEVTEIELARDEDSVMSLGVAHSQPTSLIVYAGINASSAAQKQGRNEHFRSFRVPLPVRRAVGQFSEIYKEAPATTQPLSRTAIFRSAIGPPNDGYQRITRISPPIIQQPSDDDEKLAQAPRRPHKRLTAIATGLSPQGEVVVMPTNEEQDLDAAVLRINLEDKEASDIDIIDISQNGSEFALAHATDFELFLQVVSSDLASTTTEAKKVYGTVETYNVRKGIRSKIRALRFLSTKYVLLMLNKPEKKGVELVVLRLAPDYTNTNIIWLKTLTNVKQAVGLDVCALSRSNDGSQQFAIAVAGQDSSITITTLDYSDGTMGPFRNYAELVDVHNGPITKLTFSQFHPPNSPTTKTPPQYIRLASVGVDKTVIVQTLNLTPYPSLEKSQSPRYMLVPPSDMSGTIRGTASASAVFLLILLLLVSFLEYQDVISPPILGATRYLPARFQKHTSLSKQDNKLAPMVISDGEAIEAAHSMPGPVIPEWMPSVESLISEIKTPDTASVLESIQSQVAETASGAYASVTSVIPSTDEIVNNIPSTDEVLEKIPTAEDVQLKLADLVSLKSDDESHIVFTSNTDVPGHGVTGDIVQAADGVARAVKEGTLKTYEKLSKQERKAWRKRLVEAGHLVEGQGEGVLKGILFGQLGAFAGGLVR